MGRFGATWPWSQTSSTRTTDERRRVAGLSQQQHAPIFELVHHIFVSHLVTVCFHKQLLSLPTHTAFPFPVPSVTACWHSDTSKDSFFEFSWFLFFFILSVGGFLHIYKLNTQLSSHSKTHAVGVLYCSAQTEHMEYKSYHQNVMEHVKWYIWPIQFEIQFKFEP